MKKLLMLILVLMTGFNCLNASENNGAKKEKPEKRRHSNSEDESSGQEDNARSGTSVFVNRDLLTSAFKQCSPYSSPKRFKGLNVNDSAVVDQFREDGNRRCRQQKRFSGISYNETDLDDQYTQISGSCETTPKKLAVKQREHSYFNVFSEKSLKAPILDGDEQHEYVEPVSMNPDYQSCKCAPDLDDNADEASDLDDNADEASAIDRLNRSTSQLSLKKSSNPTPSKSDSASLTPFSFSKGQRSSSQSSTPVKEVSSSSTSTPLIKVSGKRNNFELNAFLLGDNRRSSSPSSSSPSKIFSGKPRSSSVQTLQSLPKPEAIEEITKIDQDDQGQELDSDGLDAVSSKSDEEQDEIDETK